MSDDSINPDDPLPKLLAEIDQAVAMAPQAARAAKGYFDAYLGEGFTEKQAAYFTAACFNENDLEAP